MKKRRKKKRKGVDVGKFGWDPQWLRREVYFATVALVVCLFMGAGLVDRYIKESGSPYVAAVISAVLVDLANQDRVAENVGGLTINPKLVAAAQMKADDMAAKGYFSHTTPEGYDSWHWFKEAGYEYAYAGENLAVDFSESNDVEKAWMQSPSHRENILNAHYTEIGIATAKGTYRGHDAIFAVQMFGRPSVREATSANAETAPAAQESIIADLRGDASKVAREAQGATLGEAIGEEPISAGAAAEQDGDATILAPEDVPWWMRLAVQPKQTLRYAYLLIGILILAALFGDMEWELHKHHLRHAMKAGVMLATMSMLFIVADWVFFAEPILAAVGKLMQ